MAYQCIGFARNKNAAGLSRLLQPGSKVDLRTDDGVVHAQVTAKVANIAKAGVDANADAKGLAWPHLSPQVLQVCHAALHGDGHFDALQRVFAHPPAVRVTEEDHHGVANELVDRSAIVGCDARHF